jgi:outer membrane protein
MSQSAFPVVRNAKTRVRRRVGRPGGGSSSRTLVLATKMRSNTLKLVTGGLCVLLSVPLLAQRVDWSGSPYRPKTVAPVSFKNSSRIDGLLRDGTLQLSLRDAIALALENNLDLELQRLSPSIADSDVLRAKGGGTLRGVPLTVTSTPQGIGGPASPLLNSAPAGFTTSSTVAANLPNLSILGAAQNNLSITGGTPFSTGPAVPSFDPALVGQLSLQHQSSPQSNPFVTGTEVLQGRNALGSAGLIQGFSLGTQVSANFTSIGQRSNSARSLFNPFITSSLGLTVSQPLLRGFGARVNRRFLRIAKNDQKISDLVFRQQAIETIAGVIRLYYDYVSLTEDVAVKRQTQALAQKLYEDNKSQVEQGTLAPIELVRAQALVAGSRQDLANSEGFAREQELILKNVLTRRGTADPAISAARIVPSDTIPVPPTEAVRPVQDLVRTAFQNRPDLAGADLQLTNSQISLEGSHNQLLPDVDLVGTLQNNGLAGDVNPLMQGGTASPAYLGGLGTTLAQIARRNYPTYGIGIQLNLPLRNRVAEADAVRDQLQLRQSQIRRQQLENQVRLEVEDALISLERSRAAYEAAVQTRILQEQSLQAEQEKYAVGLSTTYLLVQYQSFLAQARSTEVAARGAYAKAKVALQRATGMTLDENGISVDDAYRGAAARTP